MARAKLKASGDQGGKKNVRDWWEENQSVLQDDYELISKSTAVARLAESVFLGVGEFDENRLLGVTTSGCISPKNGRVAQKPKIHSWRHQEACFRSSPKTPKTPKTPKKPSPKNVHSL